jgi:protein SCO1/2
VLRLNFHSASYSASGAARRMVILSVVGLLGLTACARERGELPAVLAGIPLTDQDGNAVGPAELAGKLLLVNFMFTSCSVVCGRQTQALEDARAALPETVRNRVRFLSVSVDPANDDASALKRFAGRYGADVPGWSFVRSDELNTQQLTLRMSAFEPGSGARPPPSAHTLGLYLFDREGRLIQRYAGSPIDVPRLSRELVALHELNTSEARLASR